MKRFFIAICTASTAFLLLSNTAQPGVWNAGGSGSFQLFFAEDSVAYKKIQMQSEQIYMQWYQGFAVVKGVYHFYNTTNDTLQIKVGYPINYVFENVSNGGFANQVTVDDLYKIKGTINQQKQPLYTQKKDEYINWYVWQLTYPPKKNTTFTVYFLVKTNDALVQKGYSSEKKDAFIYLIETGSLWKSPIEKGTFFMQLKNDFTPKQLKGTAPNTMYYNEEQKIIKFSMENYGRFPDTNFVLTHPKIYKKLNFKAVTEKSEDYFKSIDVFSTENLQKIPYKKLQLLTPYELEKSSTWNDFWIIGYVLFFVWTPIILVVLIVIYIIFFTYKHIKK